MPTLRARKRERSFNLEREERTQSGEELELEFGEICKLRVKKEEF